MTYKERVKALAEKMAQAEHKSTYKVYVKYTTTHADVNSWSANFYRDLWATVVVRYMSSARVAVAEMAQVVKKILSPNHSDEYISGWLKSEGLIPDQETPKESAFEKAIREAVERNNGQEAGSDV